MECRRFDARGTLWARKMDAALLAILQARFERNAARHKGIVWSDVRPRLKRDTLHILNDMERTGGEPDLVDLGDGLCFVDCATESPKDRRSLCYDRAALDARKTAKPDGSAVETAKSMGVEILTDAQYRTLQTLGEFDLKTSSWLLTPEGIRAKGGAIFADRRYDTVFTFHNGADSYYASRGFRALLRL